MLKHTALVAPLAFLLLTAGCGEVKQKQPPRLPDDTGSDGLGDASGGDMDTGEEENIEVAKDDGPKETKAQKRAKCCQQCVDGLPDDKSGDPPGAIPCTKLTTKMQAACVVWFDKHPTTGKEAQECVEETSPPDDGDGEGDAAAAGGEDGK